MDAMAITPFLPTPAAPMRDAAPTAPGPAADDGTPSFARELQRERGTPADAAATDGPRKASPAAPRNTPAAGRQGRGTAAQTPADTTNAAEAPALAGLADDGSVAPKRATIADAPAATADAQPLPLVSLPLPPAAEVPPPTAQSTVPSTSQAAADTATIAAQPLPPAIALPVAQAPPDASAAQPALDASARAAPAALRVDKPDSGTDAAQPQAAAVAAAPAHEAREQLLEGLRAADAPRVAGDGNAAPSTAPAPTLPSFAGELARLMSPAPAAAAAASVAELQLPVPVPSPEFVPRFSGEIALLAREGVQEARVQVHPLELGPISVQITVDGSAAQVHLAVDNAQTRALLESAMPTLAGALRENGLTLTGGGVFEQSRQGAQTADDGRDTSRRGGLRADGGDAVAAEPAPRRARVTSALDLYA